MSKTSLLGLPLVLLLLLHSAPGSLCAQERLPDPVWNTPEPFLALVLGMVDSSWQGRVSGLELQQTFAAWGKESKLPIEGIASMSRRHRGAAGRAQWIVTFDKPQSLPVPYSILGYNPGSIKTSQSFIMEEWKLGNFVFSYAHQDRHKRMALRDVTLWAIHPGTLFMDIDGWVDALMGGKLDDTNIVGFAMFRQGQQRYVAALGYNQNGEGASGVFHLNRDRILFPYPAQFQRAAGMLRARLEQLAPEAVLPYRNIRR